MLYLAFMEMQSQVSVTGNKIADYYNQGSFVRFQLTHFKRSKSKTLKRLKTYSNFQICHFAKEHEM